VKIRLGFVSNSSSSSFCIHGLGFSHEEIITLLKLGSEENGWSVRDKFRGKIAENKIEVSLEDYISESGCAVGKYFHEMKMDETREQFYKRITHELNRLYYVLGSDEKINLNQVYEITDGGYNG
jgi:hypothetical protein